MAEDLSFVVIDDKTRKRLKSSCMTGLGLDLVIGVHSVRYGFLMVLNYAVSAAIKRTDEQTDDYIFFLVWPGKIASVTFKEHLFSKPRRIDIEGSCKADLHDELIAAFKKYYEDEDGKYAVLGKHLGREVEFRDYRLLKKKYEAEIIADNKKEQSRSKETARTTVFPMSRFTIDTMPMFNLIFAVIRFIKRLFKK